MKGYERVKLAIRLALVVAMLPRVATAKSTAEVLPKWVRQLVINAAPHDRTSIEEARYKGQQAFLIMPGDRVPDSGNEHVLYASEGQIICEFGGIAGHVTVGSCEIDEIKYVRSLRQTRR